MMEALVWIYVIALVVGTYADEFYNANDLMDDTLKKLSARVSQSGDVTAHIRQLSAGGYTLHHARLADLSSFTRAGDCWMWSKDRTFFVNGTLKLDYMFIVADQMTGPAAAIMDQPIVTVQDNRMVFLLGVEMDSKASCHLNLSVSWTVLTGATLYPGEGGSVDVSKQVTSELRNISAQLAPPIIRLLEDYGNMCEGQVLSKVEMIIYEYDSQLLYQELQP